MQLSGGMGYRHHNYLQVTSLTRNTHCLLHQALSPLCCVVSVRGQNSVGAVIRVLLCSAAARISEVYNIVHVLLITTMDNNKSSCS